MGSDTRSERNKQLTKRQKKKLLKKKKKAYKKYKKGNRSLGCLGRIWKFFLTLFMILLFTAGGVGVGLGVYGYTLFRTYQASTPVLDVERLANPVPSEVYAADGSLIAKVGSEERIEITIDDVPISFLDALISTEDSRFFTHEGMDYLRTVRAAIINLTDGFGSQGGSTLTQQLVKLTFLDQNDNSLKRKTHEVTLAWELEDTYDKEEILMMYINRIYMSDGVYGVETAAQHYYGKSLSELEVHQVALLAGIPQSPNNWNPYRNPEGAKRRRDIVLYRMREENKLTESEYQEYVNTPIDEGLVPREENQSGRRFFVEKEYQLYVDRALREVREKTGLDPLRHGLRITTALDKDMQEFSNRLANTNEIFNYNNDEFMVGFSIIENATGRNIANGGGNRLTEIVPGGHNFATDTVRQGGSTMKTLLAYTPAVEYLNKGAGDRIVDEPIEYYTGQQVHNWDRQYRGEMSLQQALGSSRNVPAIKLQSEVGTTRAYELVNQMGFNYPENQFFESGSISANASPFEVAQGYSVLGNGGIFTPAHSVISVKNIDGEELYSAPSGERVIKESTAFIVSKMLETTITESYGSAHGTVERKGNQIAAKTGTTNYSQEEYERFGIQDGVPDIWFVGYTDSYTIAVWTGNDKRNVPVQRHERVYARQIFSLILDELGVRNEIFEIPDGVYLKDGYYHPR